MFFSLMWNPNMKTIREYNEQFYANKFNNGEEMNKFPEKYFPLKLNQEEDNLKRWTTGSERESVVEKNKKFPTNKSRSRWLHRRILPNIQRTFTDPSQTLPKD